MKKIRELNDVWDARRVLYNVLSYADKNGFKTHGKTWGHPCAYQEIHC